MAGLVFGGKDEERKGVKVELWVEFGGGRLREKEFRIVRREQVIYGWSTIMQNCPNL